MGRGHPLDALLFQRPVVDPFGSACPFQRSVCHRRPLGTPVVNFAGSLVVQLAGFIGQTLRGHAPRGQQDVGMVVSLVATTARSVDANIGRYTMTGNERPPKIEGQRLPIFGGKLGGQGHNEFAGNRRILSALCRFRCVPELGAISRPLGSASRGKDGRSHDATFSRVVVDLARLLVHDSFTGTVSPGGGRRPASRTAYGVDL